MLRANNTRRLCCWRVQGEEEQGHRQGLFMVSNTQSPSAVHSCLVREPVLNDDLPSYILTGRITIKPGVKEFKDSSVVFHNCLEEEPIDIIVFCTGYNVSFPFLEEAVIKVENKHASLYKYVFPTHLQRPTLAVLGLIKPLGAIMPVTEMQARWVTRVFKGRRANVSSPMYQSTVQTGHVLSPPCTKRDFSPWGLQSSLQSGQGSISMAQTSQVISLQLSYSNMSA